MSFGADHVPSRKRDKIVTEKLLPVLIGHDYQHVMAKAVIEQTARGTAPDGSYIPPKVEITIVAEGDHAQEIGDFVAANEIVALSFVGVPVRPVPKKEN